MSVFKIFRFPIIIFSDIIKFFLVYMPGVTGIHLRRAYYRKKFKQCGNNLVVDVGVCIDGCELISVGDNVFFDKNCVIATGSKVVGRVDRKNNADYCCKEGEIVIGNNVHIAQFCILMGYGGIKFGNNVVLSAGSKVYSLTNIAYDLKDKSKVVSIMPYTEANFLMSSVVLGNNVWLGLNSIVMPGVVIGKDSFCVSNSLLTDTFQDNSYIAGQPAKKIRERFVAEKMVGK